MALACFTDWVSNFCGRQCPLGLCLIDFYYSLGNNQFLQVVSFGQLC